MIESFAAFINSRVRGMKSELFPRTEMEGFLERGSVDAMIEAMLSSPYRDEMAEALTRYKGADAVEDAASRNLTHTFSKLRRLCSGRFKDLAEIFIGRWDLIAVKALLRNRHHQLDATTGAAALMPAPSIPAALLKELANQNSMEALVQALAAWNPRLCGPLVAALPEYTKSNDLRVLEEALDRAYFLGSLRRLGGSQDTDSTFLMGLLRLEIDRINLRRLFEPRDPGTSAEDTLQHLLPRSSLSMDALRNIASAPSLERAVEALEKTPYGEYTASIEQFGQAGQFGRLERMFETVFMERLKRAAQHQGIGIAVLMRFAWMKYNEVVNLRMIARGLAVQLPKSRIEEELVYV